MGSNPGPGRCPGEGNGIPQYWYDIQYDIQYSGLKKSHGQRTLEGYSPRGHKESDTTEHTRVNAWNQTQ